MVFPVALGGNNTTMSCNTEETGMSPAGMEWPMVGSGGSSKVTARSALAKRKDGVSKSKARYVVPVIAACVGLLLATLLMFPMLKMEPRNVPVGILSLDQGVSVDGESVNVGSILVGELTGEKVERPEALEDVDLLGLQDGEEAEVESSGYVSSDAVHWIVADDEEQLNDMLASGECYAVLTIPSTFSEYVVGNAGRSAIGAQLVEKLPQLFEGANALNAGVAILENGSSLLAGGASQLSNGADALSAGAGALPGAADAAKNGAGALSAGLGKLEDGAAALENGANSLEGGADQANQAIEAALAALSSDSPDMQTAMAYLIAANRAVSAMEEGASQLASGASSLSSGIAASKNGARSLGSGLDKLAQSAPSLADGAGALASGAASLDGGMSSLADGTEALHEGTQTMADGLDTANGALSMLPGEISDPAIRLVINQGKNPMVSNSLASAIGSMGASSGMTFDISYVNPLPSEMSMGFTHMILMVLTYISSYATAVVIANVTKSRRSGARPMLSSMAKQAVLACICALVIGFGGAGILVLATGAPVSFVDLALFITIASFAFQMLVMGSLDLFGMAGMVVPIGLLIIGMGTAYLPTEFLPSFWQDWVYPWDPLRFMADGFRGILYMGQGFWNPSSPVLLIMVGVGLVLMVIKLALVSRKNHMEGKGRALPARMTQLASSDEFI